MDRISKVIKLRKKIFKNQKYKKYISTMNKLMIPESFDINSCIPLTFNDANYDEINTFKTGEYLELYNDIKKNLICKEVIGNPIIVVHPFYPLLRHVNFLVDSSEYLNKYLIYEKNMIQLLKHSDKDIILFESPDSYARYTHSFIKYGKIKKVILTEHSFGKVLDKKELKDIKNKKSIEIAGCYKNKCINDIKKQLNTVKFIEKEDVVMERYCIPNRKLVLIGGGENGRPGTEYETESIDKTIVELATKKTPNFLFIGHASKFYDSYFEVMKKIYQDKFSCNCKQHTFIDIKNKKLSKELLNWADIIYVGGGNTLKMVTAWRKYNFDELLREEANKGKVLCGVSAGAICWCSYGNSDSRRFTSNATQLIKVKGLGIVKILLCPHYNVEMHRQKDLERMMKNVSKIPAIALDNCSAIVVINDKFKIITSNNTAKARKCFYKNRKYIIKELDTNTDFKDISYLVSKE